MLDRLAKDIQQFNYVVQRNWDNLPNDYRVDGHGDLDLFCSTEDANALRLAIRPYQEWLPIDVRTALDDYYPPFLNVELLMNRREHGGFWIPGPRAHFLSLYYHNAIHKKDHPYDEKLRVIFQQWISPVRPRDEGVGYFGADDIDRDKDNVG